MKKTIAILGSTGSIGKSTIDIIKKDKKNFDVILLTTNNNYREILKQSKQFKAAAARTPSGPPPIPRYISTFEFNSPVEIVMFSKLYYF